jgi:hypothetical protein
MLVDSWVAVPGSFHLDLMEVSLAPADGVMHLISPPRQLRHARDARGARRHVDLPALFG